MKIYRSSDIETVRARLKRKAESDPTVVAAVRAILDDVRSRGDAALFRYTKQFDGFGLSAANLRVSKDEIAEAYSEVSLELLDVLKKSADNIAAFHALQKRENYERRENGAVTGRLVLRCAARACMCRAARRRIPPAC
jgi:histidinol dehydrogenase